MNGGRIRTSRTFVSRAWMTMALLILAVVGLVLESNDAFAHTELLSTDPVDGSVLPAAPEAVIFSFNEPVDPVEEAFVVMASDGNTQPLEVDTTGTQVRATLPTGLATGTHVIGWRVISADGHPISGALTLSIGNVSDGVGTTAAAPPSDGGITRALEITQGLSYLGLLVAAGLLVFRLLARTTGNQPQPATWTVAAWATGLAMVATTLTMPLTVAQQYALSFRDLVDSRSWLDSLDRHELQWLIALTVGLVGALIVERRPEARWSTVLVGLGLGMAVASPTLSGHTNSFDPRWVFRLSNVLHVAAGSIWLGGLIGIFLLLRTAPRGVPSTAHDSTRLIARFSAVAGFVLAGLVISGVVNAWITLGSLDALRTTDYGRLVLIKSGLVLCAIAIAAWNHFKLVPEIEAVNDRSRAWSHLRRAVVIEAAMLCLVALATGFLVNQSPRDASADELSSPPPATMIQTDLGSGQLTGAINPPAIGQSEFTYVLLDGSGNPLEAIEPATVKLFLQSSAIGPLEFASVAGSAPGTYTATLQFPSSGSWEVEVAVRTSRFEESVARFTVEIR